MLVKNKSGNHLENAFNFKVDQKQNSLSLHPVFTGNLYIYVQDGQLVSPLFGHVGRGTLDLIICRGIAESTVKLAIVDKSQFIWQDLLLYPWIGYTPFALLTANLMVLKALRRCLLEANVNG